MTSIITNLLTPNQSDGGDTLNPELLTLNQRTGTDALGDTTGFFTLIKGDDTSLESSSTESHSGNKSLKVTTAGIQANEGIALSEVIVTNSTTYVCGCWVKSDAVGRTIRLTASSGLTGQNFTITGEWQYLEITGTTTSTSLNPHIKNPNNDGAMTFYVDDLRLAKNDTNGFNAVNSATLSISPYTSYQGYRSLEVVTPGSVIGEGTYLPVTITGYTSYSESIKIKLPEGATVELTLHSGGESKLNGSTNITGTGDWQEVVLEDIEALSTDDTFRIYIRTITSAQDITFYVDQSMLETGSKAHDWIIGQGSYLIDPTILELKDRTTSTSVLDTNKISRLKIEDKLEMDVVI